jgi:hypothetical protein
VAETSGRIKTSNQQEEKTMLKSLALKSFLSGAAIAMALGAGPAVAKDPFLIIAMKNGGKQINAKFGKNKCAWQIVKPGEYVVKVGNGEGEVKVSKQGKLWICQSEDGKSVKVDGGEAVIVFKI